MKLVNENYNARILLHTIRSISRQCPGEHDAFRKTRLYKYIQYNTHTTIKCFRELIIYNLKEKRVHDYTIGGSITLNS